jgi:hypothetical protein
MPDFLHESVMYNTNTHQGKMAVNYLYVQERCDWRAKEDCIKHVRRRNARQVKQGASLYDVKGMSFQKKANCSN